MLPSGLPTLTHKLLASRDIIVSSGSRAMYSIISRASLVLVSINCSIDVVDKFASVLLRLSYELLRRDKNGRRGVSCHLK